MEVIQMLWKCEVKNGTVWTEVEICGEDFLTEFRRRFGKLEFRNVRQYDFEKNEWVDLEI